MSKDFERVDSNFTTNVSWNRVPVPGDFLAIRKPDYSYDPDTGVATVEYFLFKKDGVGLRPAKLRELKRAAVLKHVLADCDLFRKETLENVLGKKFDVAIKICGEKVLTFGDKEPATVSFPSEHDRLFQNAYAEQIHLKIRQELESSNNFRSDSKGHDR